MVNQRMSTKKVQQVLASDFTSVSVALEESRVELDSGVVVGELVAESEVRELNKRETMNGGKLIPEFDARGGMLVAEQDTGETYAEEQVAAMQAVNSSAAGASELVIGSWEKMPNNHDRELAASVQVEADEGPFIFIYIQ